MTGASIGDLKEVIDERTATLFALCDRLATLAAGMLALTVTFRQELIGECAYGATLLKISWLCHLGTLAGYAIVMCGKISLHGNAARALIETHGEATHVPFPRTIKVGRTMVLAFFFAGVFALAGAGYFVR